MADYFFDEDEESNENIEVKDDGYNYKGYFVENEEEEEKKFYEFGAHFPYMYLYKRLEIIAQEREEEQKELEKKLLEKEKESRDDPATNEESKPNENLKDLLSIFQQKGKSRNRGDVGIGLTYIPQMNKKNNNHLNAIESVTINLVKSTAGQNLNENKDKKEININNKNNALNNNSNTKKNSCANKKEKNKSKNKIKKNWKMSQQQIKIRKRNDNNKILNINNSLNNNTVSINIINKTKFAEKINSKNMTHDIPYISKIKNNLVNKLKSIQYSKEKLRKQILNTGNLEQRLNKKLKMNNILNKFRNTNNKWSYSKCYGYQNTKNASSSKNILSKETNKKKIINSKTGICSAHQHGKNIINNANKNKSNKNSNISSHNNILNNNIKSIKEKNYIQNLKNNNNNKLLNNTVNKKFNNKNNQAKIPNHNNYKSILRDKQNIKPNSGQRKKNLEFIENIGVKKNKNNISRNNNMPLFNNQSQNNTNKNFHSVNNIYNNIGTKNIINKNQININFTNNFNNLTQQLKPQNTNKLKNQSGGHNKISISNASLKKYPPSSGIQKRTTEFNFNKNKKNEIVKKKINIINIQEKIKNYLSKNKDVKSVYNLNDKNKNINKSKNISLYKNNFFIKGNNMNSGKKNIISRNRNENNNSNEKFTGRTNNTYNTLLQNKKKHHININININNQHNIILNKMNNQINNNSTNLCSVRSTDNKGIMNNKKDKNND